MLPRACLALATATLLGACVIGGPTPTPTPLASVAATPSAPIETPTPQPTPTPEPTPGPEDIPRFTAGDRIATNAPGLRVRSRPGTAQRVVTSLGVDADLLVELGPVLVEGLGWYLVRDADRDEPRFDEGWVASGFEPDPYLISTRFPLPYNPFVAGFAHDGDGEFGPVRIADANYGMLWVAAPQSPNGCNFAVDLVPATGEPVRSVRATLGSVAAPGELFSQFFADHRELIGDIFVRVTSNCSWAVSFIRFQG
jgi:hypothetical protein